MKLILIDIIRHLVSSIFCFFTYFSKNKNIKISKFSVKNISIFFFTYTTMMLLLKNFLKENPILTLFATLIMFAYFWVESKNKREWKLMLTYSLFINLLIECVHFLSYKLILLFWYVLSLPEPKISDNYAGVVVFRAIVVILFFFAILKIYKTKFIHMKLVEKYSKNILSPIILTVSLFLIVYFKYNMKYPHSEKLYSTLTVILISLVLMFFVIIFGIKKAESKRIKEEGKQIDEALKNPEIRKKLNLDDEKYKKDKELFEAILVDMNKGERRSGLYILILCLTIIKANFTNDKFVVKRDIIPLVSEHTGDKDNAIIRNSETFINKIWNKNKNTINELDKKYKVRFPVLNCNAPPFKQFLLYVVNVARKNENDEKFINSLQN